MSSPATNKTEKQSSWSEDLPAAIAHSHVMAKRRGSQLVSNLRNIAKGLVHSRSFALAWNGIRPYEHLYAEV